MTVPDTIGDASAGALSCLYCGGACRKVLFDGVADRLGHAPGSWRFLVCAACGSAMLSPRPAPDDLDAYYPPVYSFSTALGGSSRFRRTLARLEHRFFVAPQYEAQSRIVCSQTGMRPGRPRLLDVGSGPGLRLAAFRARGFDVVGADFQPAVVAELRARGFEAVPSDIDHLSDHLPVETFDIVTAFYVLEHVTDVESTLRRCLGLLRAGGWLAAAVPLVDGLQAAVFGARWIQIGEAPRHVSLPSRGGLLRAMERAGYEELSVRPDAALNAAGVFASSLVPRASITHAYGGGSWAMLRRVGGGVAAFAAVPFVLAEAHLFGRPSHAIVFGRKPA